MINPFTATDGGQTPDGPQPVGSTGPRLADAFKWIAQNGPSTVEAARVLVEAGGAVVLANPAGPDQKAPWDLRTSEEKAHDGATHGPDRTMGGVWSATTNPDRLDALLKRAEARIGQPPNIGLNVGLSGLVLVDCDQADQVEAVQKMAQPDDPEGYVPTTRSPGVQHDDGNWHHSGGGHFLFYDNVGLGPVGKVTLESKADVFADGGRYVMVPPSKRNEGLYEVTGPVRPLSEAPWLREILSQAAEERSAQAEARRERPVASTSGLGPFDVWNDDHEWDELLEKVGWERQADLDKCGCPVWYIPDHGNRRSAIAHEPGCTHPKVNIVGDSGPLHVWTSDLPDELAVWVKDHPSKGQYHRFTKAQFAAAMWHGSDLAAFAEAEGLEAALGDLSDFRMDKVTPAEDVEWLWTSSDVLAKVRQRALAKRVAPAAVLAAALAFTSYVVPPTVRIPGIIGGDSPLNLYVGVVGSSGAGKGAATGVAKELLTGLPEGTTTTRLGTGEGLYRVLGIRPRGTDAVTDRRTYRRTTSVLYDVPEVSELNAQMQGEKVTLGSVLLQGWSGESIGNAYADASKMFVFPAQSFRMSLLVGIQPEAASALLEKDDVGFPQRLLFVSTYIGDAELTRQIAPPLSEDEKIDLGHILERFGAEDYRGFRWHHPGNHPNLGHGLGRQDGDGDEDEAPQMEGVLDGLFPQFHEVTAPIETIHYVSVCERAVNDVYDAHDAKVSRPLGYVPTREERLNAHRVLNMLRVASLLSLLQGGSGDVGDLEWDQTRVLFSMHDDAVAEMFRVVDRQAVVAAEARGKAMGHQNLKANEVVLSENEKKAELARAGAIKYLGRKDLEATDGWASLTNIRKSITYPARHLTQEVLDDLVTDGVVESREGEKAPNGKVPVLYRMT